MTTHGTLSVGRKESRVKAVAEIPKAGDTRLLETCDGREAVDDTEQKKTERRFAWSECALRKN